MAPNGRGSRNECPEMDFLKKYVQSGVPNQREGGERICFKTNETAVDV